MASGYPSSLWQGDKTILECLEYLQTSGTASDVTFLIGEHRTRIYAHKLILTCRSPVFNVMFEGLLAEKDEVIIPDIAEDIFMLFLRYLYTDKIQLTEENAAPLLNAARKYWVDDLASPCERYILGQVTSTNACMLLEQAIIFVIDTVRLKCLEVMKQDYLLRVNIQPEMLSGVYPNVMRVFTTYADIVGKARGKYWTLLTWLKDEQCEIQNNKEVTSDWHDGNMTLLECLKHICINGAKCDVTFIVDKHREQIHAHRLILISRSPLFYAMFEGLLAAKGEITIPDTSARCFRLFLRYLYTDDLYLRSSDAVAVYSVARMYCVDSCYTAMLANINVHNVWAYLEQAHIFASERLKTKCFELIVKYPTETLRSPLFGKRCSRCMASVAESDDIHEINEGDVYEAVMDWAEQECSRQGLQESPSNHRKVLGDMIYVVRFPIMDKVFCHQLVCQDRILSSEDINQLIYVRPTDALLLKFNGSPRLKRRWALIL